MKMMTMKRAFAGFALLALVAAPIRAQEALVVGGGRAAVAQAVKTVKILAVGNSFSGDSTAYFNDLVDSSGNKLVFGHASIGGCPLDKHIRLAKLHEEKPTDPEGMPYSLKGEDGKSKKAGLKEMLLSQPWEFVTIQQASIKSFKGETFQPYGHELADYIHKYAPQAKIVVHETWAYRADQPMFEKKGSEEVTRQEMYDRLHVNYAKLAKDIGAAGVIPVGTAYEAALKDARWTFKLAEKVDTDTYVRPALPEQVGSLHVGYWWPKDAPTTQPDKLGYDGNHSSRQGRYLGASCWYEYFYGDVRGLKFVPEGVSEEQAAVLREIAHATVKERAPAVGR